ncbi:MAG: cytoplasmic protein [Deltaproteobacteria bacterium]|nr:cytoplasmic protein [Deltaproteobacteria bacterium]
MSETDSKTNAAIKVNAEKLYREETYTDTEVCYFRQLIPIRPDGSQDPARKPIFMGMTHVVTEAGPVPVQAALEAKTLDEAILEFPEAAKKALDDLVTKAKEAQIQRSRSEPKPQPSRIVVP